MAYTGLPFQVITADTEEVKEGPPKALVMENARRKARAVWDKHPGAIVLGADTVVYQDGLVLGKPKDASEARAMLSRLQGSRHAVYTGVCVIDAQGRENAQADESLVYFTSMDEKTIDWYVSSGEPMDKAGAYAVQGRGGMFVSRVEGSYSNVIGLPMALVKDMLLQAGAELF